MTARERWAWGTAGASLLLAGALTLVQLGLPPFGEHYWAIQACDSAVCTVRVRLVDTANGCTIEVGKGVFGQATDVLDLSPNVRTIEWVLDGIVDDAEADNGTVRYAFRLNGLDFTPDDERNYFPAQAASAGNFVKRVRTRTPLVSREERLHLYDLHLRWKNGAGADVDCARRGPIISNRG
jgi:hypothetical protein